ncbi:MAG: hypothetical protein OEZ10_01880 [Gammaproteobacteria bacterium]|nr:hypothetical protein [Gammaproteobacteria bacterium]
MYIGRITCAAGHDFDCRLEDQVDLLSGTPPVGLPPCPHCQSRDIRSFVVVHQVPEESPGSARPEMVDDDYAAQLLGSLKFRSSGLVAPGPRIVTPSDNERKWEAQKIGVQADFDVKPPASR